MNITKIITIIAITSMTQGCKRDAETLDKAPSTVKPLESNPAAKVFILVVWEMDPTMTDTRTLSRSAMVRDMNRLNVTSRTEDFADQNILVFGGVFDTEVDLPEHERPRGLDRTYWGQFFIDQPQQIKITDISKITLERNDQADHEAKYDNHFDEGIIRLTSSISDGIWIFFNPEHGAEMIAIP